MLLMSLLLAATVPAPAIASAHGGNGTGGLDVGIGVGVAPSESEAAAGDPLAPSAAMAGAFFGSLPIAACAQADVLLRLHDGGRYTLQAHCRATLEDFPLERGAWALEWNGTCVRLVPEDGVRAHEFALVTGDLLVLAPGSCIEPIEDPRGRSLHRAQPGTAGH